MKIALRSLSLAAGCGLFFVCLSGCGENKQEIDDPTDKEIYEAFLTDYNRAVCEREQRCDDTPDFASTEECLANLDPTMETQRERIAESIGKEQTAYYAEQATTCLEKQNGSCDLPYQEISLPCSAVIEGLVELGDDCVGHFECKIPAGHVGLGPYCFEGCVGLFGHDVPLIVGQCYLESQANTPECQ